VPGVETGKAVMPALADGRESGAASAATIAVEPAAPSASATDGNARDGTRAVGVDGNVVAAVGAANDEAPLLCPKIVMRGAAIVEAAGAGAAPDPDANDGAAIGGVTEGATPAPDAETGAAAAAGAADMPTMPTGIEKSALRAAGAVVDAADAADDAAETPPVAPAPVTGAAADAVVLVLPSGSPLSAPVGFCVVVPGISAPHAIGVSVAVLELAVPDAFVARTQYVAVCVIAGVVKLADVAPAIGFDVSPLVPRYHWYEIDPAPDASTLNVTVCPEITPWLSGRRANDGNSVAAGTV
jgi:hypothetical protein